MFGDAGAEIERMTASVKDDMRTVGTRLDGLQVCGHDVRPCRIAIAV